MTESDLVLNAHSLLLSTLIRHIPKELQQSLLSALEQTRPRLRADPSMIAALDLAIQYVDSIHASDEAPSSMRDILKVIPGGKIDT